MLASFVFLPFNRGMDDTECTTWTSGARVVTPREAKDGKSTRARAKITLFLEIASFQQLYLDHGARPVLSD